MAARSLLFHGRHLLHTTFQGEALRTLVERLRKDGDTIEVVFAVTSANHSNSRYNPVPFHYRAIGIDLFARRVLLPLSVEWTVVPVPHLPPTEHFAARVVSYANAAREMREPLAPGFTSVFCSTPPLIRQFRSLGYDVDTAEFDEETDAFTAPAPQGIIAAHAATLSAWQTNAELGSLLSPATRALWKTYPDIPREIERLWNESLLTEHGDITETRDYGTYSFSMSRTDVIERKYEDIKAGIVPGRIVDEGCADGALLIRIAKDFPDSDLIGVEITREFLAEAHERQRRGEFGQTFVFFYQRNLAEKIFEDNSIDTTICNSTTHEIWSYGGQDETLRAYLRYKYAQLRPGGALVIRDVIGPENGDEPIYALFEDADGLTPPAGEAPRMEARTLSTRGRFYRFAHDFFNGRGVAYSEELIDGKTYIVASRRDIAEFLSKKDYVENWDSEMHEDFTHWPFSVWMSELTDAGFTPDAGLSHAYANSWIVEHHLKGTAELFRKTAKGLEPEPYAPTNVILVARK